MASVSRIDQITGLFYKRAQQKRQYSTKKTDNLIDPTVCSYPICRMGPVLQYVVVCCGVLRCVAVCCSGLQCVAVCCSVLQCVTLCCSVLQCVAVCCSASHSFDGIVNGLCAAVCCGVRSCVWQCVAVCDSV